MGGIDDELPAAAGYPLGQVSEGQGQRGGGGDQADLEVGDGTADRGVKRGPHGSGRGHGQRQGRDRQAGIGALAGHGPARDDRGVLAVEHDDVVAGVQGE
ncbi:MAG: hypothetical protein KBB39_07330 [Phycicoccus sp.]|nr:hypothetical protein [Phycicoccus sp.]